MKVIFLDIDGVLVPFSDNFQRGKIRDLFQKMEIDGETVILPKLHKESADNLWRIITETGAHIVISSSWRHRWSHLQKMLQSSENEAGDNLWNHVTSKTPSMTGGGRGNEILQYLSDYHKTCKEGFHITHWIAIDDSDAGMSRIRDLNSVMITDNYDDAVRLLNISKQTKRLLKVLNK